MKDNKPIIFWNKLTGWWAIRKKPKNSSPVSNAMFDEAYAYIHKLNYNITRDGRFKRAWSPND